jgi:3-oxoacyl-(acyl-carrier-protein) synthase
VSAHATSTPVGDKAEAVAIGRLFGSKGLRPPVAATKGLTGHGLSMAGSMQAAFCVLSIDGGFIPGNPHLRDPDPECASLELPRVTLANRPALVLSNSCGFGGSNVCHVLAAPGTIPS